MSDENTCYYSPGHDKHECCTHQHFCIFNKNRIELEKTIMKNWRDYYALKKLHNSYLKGDYCEDIDYSFLLKKMDLIKHNLSRLVNFKQKILDKKVDGYGILES